MDYYLEELESTAIQAFAEMGAAFPTTTTADVPVSNSKAAQRRVLPRPKIQATYLLRLESPLLTSRDVANNLSLPRVPRTEIGYGASGIASFCHLNEDGVGALETWTALKFPSKRWVTVRVGLAHKGETLPLLGSDATLPQNRPSLDSLNWSDDMRGVSYPTQFFFYGTLENTSRLSRLLGLPTTDVPELRPATLHDGRIRLWANKYCALVDSPGGQVQGSAFWVKSAPEEDALRRYEGDSYEIVAARFVVAGTVVHGRTFRFAGYKEELSG